MSLGKLYGLLAGAMLFGEYKMSSAERRVSGALLMDLVNEYNLIQDKKSSLSRRLRDLVEARVNYLVEQGCIIRNEDGKVTIEVNVKR
jgi:hypothetical protein